MIAAPTSNVIALRPLDPPAPLNLHHPSLQRRHRPRGRPPYDWAREDDPTFSIPESGVRLILAALDELPGLAAAGELAADLRHQLALLTPAPSPQE